jgi:predicted TIM-barrel fold metal-dependent hydrolase
MLAVDPVPEPVRIVGRAPRQFAELLGKLLFWCGEDKIVYGSEAPIWQPQWALQAFWDFQIPQDLCEGYGYPQLTDQAKRKILGENLLRLHGMDVTDTVGRLGRKQAASQQVAAAFLEAERRSEP